MQRRFRFGPHPNAGWILGLRVSHIVGIVVAGVIALALMRLKAPLSIGLVGIDFALAFVVVGVTFAGHTSLEWVPVVGRFLVARLDGTNIFRSRHPGWGGWVELPEERTIAPKPVETVISLPGELSDVVVVETPLYAQGGIPMGVVKDKRARTYTATIRCSARAFYLLGEEERAMLLASYGALLTQFASDDSPVRRIGWYERTSPSGRSELQEYLRENARAGISEDDSGLVATRQLLAAQGQELDHEVLVSLQISSGNGRRAIGQRGGGDDGALAVLCEQVGKLVEELSRIGATHTQPVGARNPAVPDARQLAAIIRDGIDPFTRHEREEPPAGGERGIDPAQFGPGARDALLDASAGGRVPARHRALVGVPAPGRPRAVPAGASDGSSSDADGGVGDARDGTAESGQASRAPGRGGLGRGLAAATDRQTDNCARPGPRSSTSRRSEDELARGHALVQFAGYVTVSVPESHGIAGLDAAFGRVQAQALAVGLRLERMHGEQQDALTYTLPLCRGLL